MLLLWRTNMLRQTRLKVIDEVANGLSYYDYHVLSPRKRRSLYAHDRGRSGAARTPPGATAVSA